MIPARVRSDRALGRDWVAVWHPRLAGKAWLEAYEVFRYGDTKDLRDKVRLRVQPERPHPRSVLPLAVLTWSAGLASSIPDAATLVAARTLEDSVAALPADLSLPVSCATQGRCEMSPVGSGFGAPVGADPAEQVALALTHAGRCTAVGKRDLDPSLLQWPTSPRVAPMALSWWAALRAAKDLAARERQLAGYHWDEGRLVFAWPAPGLARGMANYAAWKDKAPAAGPDCTLCGGQRRPAGSPCRSCASYPLGPRPRDTVLDRLEVRAGVLRPAGT